MIDFILNPDFFTFREPTPTYYKESVRAKQDSKSRIFKPNQS